MLRHCGSLCSFHRVMLGSIAIAQTCRSLTIPTQTCTAPANMLAMTFADTTTYTWRSIVHVAPQGGTLDNMASVASVLIAMSLHLHAGRVTGVVITSRGGW